MHNEEIGLHTLKEGLALMGLPYSEPQRKQMKRFIEEIHLFNNIYHLVGATGEELVIKHVLDSLVALPHIISCKPQKSSHVSIADLGSGAGFPGIPLAIMDESFHVTLVERMARRAGFLQNTITLCNLQERVHVLEKDLSAVHQQFDIVVFRAFRPLIECIDNVDAILSTGGIICAYKGRRDAIEAELDDLTRYWSSKKRKTSFEWSCTIKELQVPFLDAPRHLCLISRDM